ncbi:MAG TPA: hypothetical protein VMF30_07075 [Pirellulales bacterium]|nr:hypothetical protein [Pirellulales bacterium]
MDDVHPSTDSASRQEQRALADELHELRQLLEAERVSIATLESRISAGTAQLPVPHPAHGDADRLVTEAAQLSALMDDLARREADLESARHELAHAQRTGGAAVFPFPGEHAQIDDLRRQNEARRQQLSAEAERLSAQRDALEQEATDLTIARDELNQAKADLVRQQQQLASSRAAFQVEQLERDARESQAARDRQRYEIQRRQLDVDLDRLATAEAAAQIEAERLERTKQQLHRQTERLEHQRRQFEADQTKLAQEHLELKLAQESARASQAEFTRAHERLEADRERLALERDRLVALESDTKNQRRRIAREFRVQHATRLAELVTRREEIESLVSATEAELQSSAAAGGGERPDDLVLDQQEEHELRQRVASLGKLLNSRAGELRELRAQLAALTLERDALRDQLAAALQSPNSQNSAAAVEALSAARVQEDAARAKEIAQLRDDRDALAAHLAAAQQQLETAGGMGEDEADAERRYELQRRFEMAVQDLREQKERNILLEKQLASRATSAPAPSAMPGDWESQKRHLLETLAAETDDEDGESHDPEIAERRLSLEATIAITDEVVSQKDREITELRQLLQEQAGNIGSIAVGATAIADMLNQDELIAQERARLAEMQAEWREKLRQAEIDISVQRATIARDRAQIDERLADHQSVVDRLKSSAPQSENGAKPSRRWLSRLGLKETEE